MKTSKLALLLFAALLMADCDNNDDPIVIEKGKPLDTSGANTNKNNTNGNAALARLEFPKTKNNGSLIIVHRAVLNGKINVEGINYCVEWDPSINAQRWSCFQLYSTINYSSASSGNVSRYSADNDGTLSPTCQYPNDADLPATYQWAEDPYKYSGYDHGHICASADRQRAKEANYQTFYITNMQPQFNKFNAGLWEKMEGDVRTWANLADTLYVCKGGTIDKKENILEYISRNSHQQSKVNNKHIPVPRYFFMAVLSRKGTTWNALGYWVENLNEDHTNDTRKNYAISIDKLEQLTGLDFFCNLPDEIEDKVESSLNTSFWFK